MVTGSLQTKNGTFYAVLSFYNEDKEKWDQKWKTTKIKDKKGNKKKAENKLKEIQKEFEKQLKTKKKVVEQEEKEQKNNHNKKEDREDTNKETAENQTIYEQRINANKNKTFVQYVLESIEDFKSDIEETTYDAWYAQYNGRVRNFFIPYHELDKIMNEDIKRNTYYETPLKISEITQFDIEDFFKWMYDCGLKSGTVEKHYVLFNLIFERAIRQKIITPETNPMNDVKKPVVKPYIANFYTAKELKQLSTIIKEDVLEIAILLASHYGLRRSEVLGIKWQAIDFDTNIIIIKHTVTKVKGTGENQIISCKNLAKTDSGYRTYPLAPTIREKLLEHRKNIEENRKFFGNTYVEQTKDYVCVKENGELIKPNHFTKRFKDIIKRNDIRKIRPHDLRHSVGSLLAIKNVNQKLIQDFMGHANISSSDRYMHLQFESKEFSSKIIEEELA